MHGGPVSLQQKGAISEPVRKKQRGFEVESAPPGLLVEGHNNPKKTKKE